MCDITIQDLETSSIRLFNSLFFNDLLRLQIKLDYINLYLERLYLCWKNKIIKDDDFEDLSSKLNEAISLCSKIFKLGGYEE